MKESQFGFVYTWSDLAPVRPLFLTVLVAQLLGAAFGFFLQPFPNYISNLWAGGAIATFPGFLLGLLIQSRLNSTAIRANLVMVRRMGLVALALSLFVLVVDLEKF